MKKMSDDDLLALLQRKESSAAQYVHGQLGQERETAMREYYRLPYGTEEDDGWSKIITSDVADSVEWILPALLKSFTSTDKAVILLIEDVVTCISGLCCTIYILRSRRLKADGFICASECL